MKTHTSIIALTLILSTGFVLTGCPSTKPVIRTVNNIAYDLCIAERSKEAPKLSLEDIGKVFCDTEEALKPFLDAILAAKKLATASSASTSASGTPSTSAPSASEKIAPSVPSAPAKASAAASALSKPSALAPAKASVKDPLSSRK